MSAPPAFPSSPGPGDPAGPYPSGLRKRLSWKQAFTALKYPNYRLWFWSQMFSLFGTWMANTAQAFFIFELTRSSAYLGYIGFALGAPTWVFMLYAGVIADRMPKRRLLLITQISMMILGLTLAALTFLGVVLPWHILAVALLFGVANAFDAPARQAFILEMVELDDLTNAIALNSAMFNTATAVGPAVAGIIYAAFGPAWCFTVNGLSFLAVIIALRLMKLKPFVPKPNRTSALADLKEGLRYVARQPTIRTIIIIIGIFSLFGIAFATLVPAWAVRILGGDARTNGFLQSARGAGALAGALLIAALGRFHFRGRLLTIGTFAMPLLLMAFSFVRWTPLSVALLLPVGMSLIVVFNLSNALVQTAAPHELRGRIMSVYTLTFFGLMPIGALGMGIAAEHLGEPATVFIGASAMLVGATVLAVFVPRIRRQT
jgi:MFS family permease